MRISLRLDACDCNTKGYLYSAVVGGTERPTAGADRGRPAPIVDERLQYDRRDDNSSGLDAL